MVVETSGTLAMLSVIANQILVPAVKATIELSGSPQTTIRRLRLRTLRRIERMIIRTPPSPETNHHILRVLALAWADTAHRFASRLPQSPEAEYNRELLKFRAALLEDTVVIEKRAHDQKTDFDFFLSQAITDFAAWIEGRVGGQSDEEKGLADLDLRLLGHIETHMKALVDLPETIWPVWKEIRRDLSEKVHEPFRRGRPIIVMELLDGFHAKIVGNEIPEATEAFKFYAQGQIKDEIAALRAEMLAEAAADRAATEALFEQLQRELNRGLLFVAARQGRALEALQSEMRDALATFHLDSLYYREVGFGLDRLTYRNAEIPFLGRAREKVEIDRFLDAPPGEDSNFRWWICTGSGGSGKSRLALETCNSVIARRGWDAGFINRDGLPDKVADDTFVRWQPRRATLLIVDYPSAREDAVAALLRGLSRGARSHNVPVRVLLLEREVAPAFASALLGTGSDRGPVNATYFGEGSLAATALNLGDDGAALNDVDLFRLALKGHSLSERDEIPSLLADERTFAARHVEIDGMRRPLTALLLGYVGGAETQIENLLAAALHRDVDRHWPQELREQDRAWLEDAGGSVLDLLTLKARRWLALATMTGGIVRGDVSALSPEEADWLARSELDQPELDRLRRAVSGAAAPPSQLPSLQPDLVGEYFCLEALLPLADGFKEIDNTRLAEIAWRVADRRQLDSKADVPSREAMEDFALRARQNFPDHASIAVIEAPVQGVAGTHAHFVRRSLLSGESVESQVSLLIATIRDDASAAIALGGLLQSAIAGDEPWLPYPTFQVALETLFQCLTTTHDPIAWQRYAAAARNFVFRRAAEEHDYCLLLLSRVRGAAEVRDEPELWALWAETAVNYIRGRVAKEPDLRQTLLSEMRTIAEARDAPELWEQWARAVVNVSAFGRDQRGLQDTLLPELRTVAEARNAHELRILWATACMNYVSSTAAEDPYLRRALLLEMRRAAEVLNEPTIWELWSRSAANYVGLRAAEEPDLRHTLLPEMRAAAEVHDEPELWRKWAEAAANYVDQRAAEEPELRHTLLPEMRAAAEGHDALELWELWARAVANYVGLRAAEEPDLRHTILSELRAVAEMHDAPELWSSWARAAFQYLRHCAAKEPDLRHTLLPEMMAIAEVRNEKELWELWAKAAANYVAFRVTEEPDLRHTLLAEIHAAAETKDAPELWEIWATASNNYVFGRAAEEPDLRYTLLPEMRAAAETRSEPRLWEQWAKAAFHFVVHRAAHEPDLRHTLLPEMRAAFETHEVPKLLEHWAKAAKNIFFHRAAEEPDLRHTLLREMRIVAEVHDEPKLWEEWASAAGNYSAYRAAAEPDLRHTLLPEVRAVAEVRNTPKLWEEWASVAFNVVTGRCAEEPDLRQTLLPEMRAVAEFHDAPKLWELWAKAAACYVLRHAAEDPDLCKTLLSEMRSVAEARDASELWEHWAMGSAIIVELGNPLFSDALSLIEETGMTLAARWVPDGLVWWARAVGVLGNRAETETEATALESSVCAVIDSAQEDRQVRILVMLQPDDANRGIA